METSSTLYLNIKIKKKGQSSPGFTSLLFIIVIITFLL